MSQSNKNVKKQEKPELTKKQYEELGRVVAAIYETGYLNQNQSFKMSFVKGVFQGFGGVIGATLVVALLIWALSFFDGIPLLGDFINNIQETVEQGPVQQP